MSNLTGINKVYVGCEPTNGNEANAIFDEFQVFRYDLNDTEVSSYFYKTQPTNFSTLHQILAHFNSGALGLEGGNLSLDNLLVTNWRLYKKKSNNTQYKLIYEIANNNTVEYLSTEDFEVANNQNYDYTVEGIDASGNITRKYELLNNQIKFRGIWLVDKNTGKTFQFLFNRPDTQIDNKRNRNQIETFSQFPLFWRDEVNYEHGNLECLVLTDDMTPYQKVQELKLLENSNNLIIKFDTGEIYLADIGNISRTYVTETDNELATIKCEWTQVGEVK